MNRAHWLKMADPFVGAEAGFYRLLDNSRIVEGFAVPVRGGSFAVRTSHERQDIADFLSLACGHIILGEALVQEWIAIQIEDTDIDGVRAISLWNLLLRENDAMTRANIEEVPFYYDIAAQASRSILGFWLTSTSRRKVDTVDAGGVAWSFFWGGRLIGTARVEEAEAGGFQYDTADAGIWESPGSCAAALLASYVGLSPSDPKVMDDILLHSDRFIPEVVS